MSHSIRGPFDFLGSSWSYASLKISEWLDLKFSFYNIVAYCLKARISESQRVSRVRKRLCIHDSVTLSGWQRNRFTRQTDVTTELKARTSAVSEVTNTYIYRRTEHLKRNPWTRRFLSRPTVGYNRTREVRIETHNRGELRRGQIRGDQNRGERSRAESRRMQPSRRRQTSQVTSFGRSYFRTIVTVIVNDLSSKQLRLIRNSFISCRVTRTRDNILLYIPKIIQESWSASQ
jgi:hypothetical protein